MVRRRLGDLSFMVAGELGEHLAEAGHMQGDAAAGNDKGNGDEDERYAESFTGSHPFSEYGDAENDGGYRLQCSENGSGCGADVLDGAGGAEERDGRRENRQRQYIEPHVPA